MKMFRDQTFDYLSVFIFFFLLNVSQACFRNNEHGSTSLPTGSPYYEECQCTEPGYTIKNLQWLGIDDRPIEPGPGTDSDVYIEEQSDGINLHIRKISKTMSGTYKCITFVDGVKYVQSYTIDVYDPLYFFKTPSDQFLVETHDSSIICRAHGESDLLIRWQKKVDASFVEIVNNEKYSIESDGLRVRNVSMNDAGIYKCIAQGITTGEELDTVINVEITTIPEIVEIRATPGPTVIVGSHLTLDCLAEGTPHPDYAWKKIDNDTKSYNVTGKQQVNTLVFENIGSEDRGTYQCIAYNSAGGTFLDIFIEVLVPPEIFYFPNITILEGELMEIFCNASGRSEPNITLAFLGPELDNIVDENYEDKVIPDGSLILAHRSDEGFYICNASNEVDYTLSEMYLTVLRPPQFEEPHEIIWGWDGKTVGLSCIHDSKPKAQVHWRFDSNELATADQVEYNKMLLELLNKVPENYLTISLNKNSSYGIYSCTAKNEYGEATKNITLKHGFRPSTVYNITIIDITPTTVTFHLTAADFEGPDVLGFIAQYDEAENYNITDIHVNRTWSRDRPYKLEKLKPDTLYYVSFAAINEVGEGEWSDKIDFVTLGKSVPEAPILESESITFTSKNNNLLLKWEEPDNNGDPIDYYTIRYCSVNASEEQNVISNEITSEENDKTEAKKCKAKKVMSSTKTEITDLKENTTYFLELMAHNAKGNSNAVNISVTISAPENIESTLSLSGAAIIGLSIVIVLICLVLFDLLLLVWRRQGVMASLCIKKKKETENTLNSRDKKGLLNRESTDDNRHNGHKEFEYNKSTGTVTGKHSAV